MAQVSTTQLGLQTLHRPRHAAIPSQGMDNAARRPNKAPVAFACKAPRRFPRIRWAHDVVIPQAGHRTPNKATHVHGGRPNC